MAEDASRRHVPFLLEATPTSTTHMGASAQTLTPEQKHEGRALQRRSLVLHFPMDSQNLAVTAGDAGYHGASLLGESTEGIGTGRPALSSLRAQYMFFYCSKHVLPLVSTEKKKKSKLTFVEQILAFVHIKGQEKGTKAPCN